MNTMRENLHFIDNAINLFSFLVNEYNFKCISKGSYTVIYKSDNVIVNIYHEKISFELSIALMLLIDDKAITITLNDIIESEANTLLNTIMASSKESVCNQLKQLSDLLRKYADEFLKGEKEAFNKVYEFKQNKYQKLQKERMINNLLKEADIAWNNKDYKKVVMLLSSIKEDLNKIELFKFKYAQKMIDN